MLHQFDPNFTTPSVTLLDNIITFFPSHPFGGSFWVTYIIHGHLFVLCISRSAIYYTSKIFLFVFTKRYVASNFTIDSYLHMHRHALHHNNFYCMYSAHSFASLHSRCHYPIVINWQNIITPESPNTWKNLLLFRLRVNGKVGKNLSKKKTSLKPL